MADINRAAGDAEDHQSFDRQAALQLGAWCFCALMSMGLVVFVAQTDLGTKRAAAGVAAIVAPPRDTGMTVAQVLARTAESDREARRLGDIVRSLSSERDRLAIRVDSVEREMGDLTGSIARVQAVATPKPALPDTKAPAPSIAVPAPVIPPPATTAATIKHAVVPPTPVPPQATENAGISSPTITTSSMIPAVPSPAIDPRTAQAVWPRIGSLFTPPATVPAAVPASPMPPSPDELPLTKIPPADMPEEIPLPRPSPLAALQAAAMQSYSALATQAPSAPPPANDMPKSANSSAASTETTASVAETEEPQPKVEIGVDLGPALTMARLRARWEAFKKSQGPTANDLRPVVSIREIGSGKPVEMRLVIGPFADVGLAAKLCASLAGSQFPCQPAVFDGQRLALY